MKIRCVVADDEPLAIKLITDYISRIPHLHLIGTCKNATDIPGYIGRFDLLFLDIRMPGLSGLEFLRSMHTRPLVILITAYSEYALEGFDLDVVDYLVKPVGFERFLQAINKATQRFRLQSSIAPEAPAPPSLPKAAEKAYLFVKSGYKSVRVNYDDVLYVEGLKEYVSIFTSGGSRFVKLAALKDLERILPRHQFLRIHKSYIVAVARVTAAYGNSIEIGQITLPVGRSYKDAVMKVFS